MGTDTALSYDELFRAWRREKESGEVQPLPKDFYTRLSQYIRALEEERGLTDEKALRAKLLAEELKNVRRMAKGLHQTRLWKILQGLQTRKAVSPEALTREEEDLYTILKEARLAYNRFLEDVLDGRTPLVKIAKTKEKPKRILVRFLQPIPAIVGADMKMYGPYKAEDVATLPTKNAEALVRRGIAVRVEIE